MREIVSVFNSNGAYATAPHEHREFMVLVPEHGMLRFTDEANNWSTTLIERQFLLVPPHWTHSSASLTGDQGHVAFYVDPDYMGYALGDLSGEASRVLRVPTLGIWHTSAPLHHLLLAKKELRRPSPFVDRRRQVAQADHLLLLECLAISLSQPSVRRSSTERHGAALVRDVRAYLVPLHSGFDRLAPETVRSGKGCFQAERCSGRGFGKDNSRRSGLGSDQ